MEMAVGILKSGGIRMDLLSSNVSLSLTQNKFPDSNCLIGPFHITTHSRHFPILRSKHSFYQDFHEYAKPSRLLPASEVTFLTDILDEEKVASFMLCGTESFYKIKLQTSNIYGSDLTDFNSGLLLCLIDENGSSILQRLPAIGNTIEPDDAMTDIFHFQRGAADEFFFKGSTLGKIIAVWIGLESGQWRIGGASLTVVSLCQFPPSENYQINQQYTSFQYNFEVEDVMLGDKSDISMIELKPHQVTAISGDYFGSFFEKTSQHPSTLAGSYLLSNKQSMKEYAYLKFSLLFYDAILVLAGYSFWSIMTRDNTSFAFLTGGTCGFLCLLLLQRSVDGLPVQELVPEKEKVSFGGAFERFKGPVSSVVVLILAFVGIGMKYAYAKSVVQLTPKDLVVGMVGFLMCKVSIVMAAFKPLSFSLREEK